MKLIGPIARVSDAKLPDGAGVRAVEIDGRPPVGGLLSGKILRSVLRDVVPVRAQMIVDHIQDYAHSERMRSIHEAAKVVGQSIQMCRCEQLHAIVAPAEAPWKLGDGHQFENSNPSFGQLRQMLLST